MTLSDILKLPNVWARLLGKQSPNTQSDLARRARKLIPGLAERERKLDVLKRIGVNASAENLYPPPPPPEPEKKD